jgi:hypothetical protein
VPHGPFRLNCAPGWDEIQPVNESESGEVELGDHGHWVQKVRSWGAIGTSPTRSVAPQVGNAARTERQDSSEWYLHSRNVTDEAPIIGHYKRVHPAGDQAIRLGVLRV